MIETFVALIVFTLILVGVYAKLRIPMLYVSLYGIFLVIFAETLSDGDVPLFPWGNLFCIILATALLIDIGFKVKGEN